MTILCMSYLVNFEINLSFNVQFTRGLQKLMVLK